MLYNQHVSRIDVDFFPRFCQWEKLKTVNKYFFNKMGTFSKTYKNTNNNPTIIVVSYKLIGEIAI